jgi:hypothetical protein
MKCFLRTFQLPKMKAYLLEAYSELDILLQ